MYFHCTEFIDTPGFDWDRDEGNVPDRLCLCMTVPNKALSQFTNFNFRTFGMIGDKIIAGNEDGVYLLDGETDDDCPIQAWFKFGHDFESDGRLRSVVMNLETSNQVTVTVWHNEDNSHVFTMTPKSISDKQAIAKETRDVAGRGRRGSFVEFKVANTGGNDLSVDSIKVYRINLGHRRS